MIDRKSRRGRCPHLPGRARPGWFFCLIAHNPGELRSPARVLSEVEGGRTRCVGLKRNVVLKQRTGESGKRKQSAFRVLGLFSRLQLGVHSNSALSVRFQRSESNAR